MPAISHKNVWYYCSRQFIWNAPSHKNKIRIRTIITIIIIIIERIKLGWPKPKLGGHLTNVTAIVNEHATNIHVSNGAMMKFIRNKQ